MDDMEMLFNIDVDDPVGVMDGEESAEGKCNPIGTRDIDAGVGVLGAARCVFDVI
jgi:hypothetical protein